MLKGIVGLAEFKLDLVGGTIRLKKRPYGEKDSLELCLEDFSVFHDGEPYRFIICHACSDERWLRNLLAKLISTTWKVPAMPQLSAQLILIAEVLKTTRRHWNWPIDFSKSFQR
ncbi:hypothetical protein [Methylomonas sp. CM2]|uniref:hypothetical protein n=1 Tax=Methylomonas sp. CM2 TaxID=3417647 RepID=UPI003CF985AF